MSPIPQLRLRSSVPGRERWEVKGLAGAHGLAEALEKALLAEQGVVLVRANPITGRVLIRFEVGGDVRCRLLLRAHLRTILARGIAERSPNAGGNPLVRILRASPVSSRQAGVAATLSIVSQIVAVARRVTLISTINIALS